MGASEFSKSAPSLKVIAPTSQLAAARNRSDQLARSGSRRRPRSDPNSSNSEFAVELTNSVDGTQLVDDELGERQSMFGGLIHGLPSWLVSLIFHLALLLILAITSFGFGNGDRQFVLEFADSPAQFEMNLTEIEFDDFDMKDEQEMLDPFQQETLEAEMPMIPIDMMEVFNDQNLVSEIPELGFVGEHVASPRSSDKKKGAMFFGTKSYGSRFVFVIDCSLSMKGNRWYHALKELNTAIDGLEPGQEFLVLLYNERASVMMDTRADLAALVKATDENKEKCRKWLRKQRTQGGTFPATAMFIGLAMNPDAIFLLSDGELQDNTQELLNFWNIEQKRENGTASRIPINTISLGQEGIGQDIMKAIAKENAGTFTWIR